MPSNKNCTTCKHDTAERSERCSECVVGGNKAPSLWETNKTITNADYIRSMSNEELAMVIMCPYGIAPDSCIENCDCLSCCLDWLRQDYKHNGGADDAKND